MVCGDGWMAHLVSGIAPAFSGWSACLRQGGGLQGIGGGAGLMGRNVGRCCMLRQGTAVWQGCQQGRRAGWVFAGLASLGCLCGPGEEGQPKPLKRRSRCCCRQQGTKGPGPAPHPPHAGLQVEVVGGLVLGGGWGGEGRQRRGSTPGQPPVICRSNRGSTAGQRQSQQPAN